MSANISSHLKTVTTSPTRLAKATNVAAAGRDGRITFEFHNSSNQTLYMGGPTVTVETGMPLPPGASRTIALALYGEAYAIAEEGTATVRVMKVP